MAEFGPSRRSGESGAKLQAKGTAGVPRLFFALWPDAIVRDAIARQAERLLAGNMAHARRTIPHRYHLTLMFLGACLVPLPRLIDAAGLVRSNRFTLTLDARGGFRGRMGAWWVGCRQAPGDLVGLRRALAASLAALGLEDDERFAPHVTFARSAIPLTAGAIEPIAWDVASFALVESITGARPEYIVHASFPLAGAD